jgi:hypothetical protein
VFFHISSINHDSLAACFIIRFKIYKCKPISLKKIRAFWDVAPYSLVGVDVSEVRTASIIIALMMEVVRTSKKSVIIIIIIIHKRL